MKRYTILLTLGIVLGSLTCGAEVVPRDRAAARAAGFFARKAARSGVTASGTMPRLVKEYDALYVFENEGGGYVVVSGDDVARPVLGYSLSGRFPADNPPENMLDLLAWYDSVIKYARSRGWTASAGVRDAWATQDDGEEIGEAKLETALWGQGSPFNDLSPTVDGQKCPSGCVATAMAIIMRYHKYPDHGTGTLPGYDYYWSGGKYKYHIDGYDLGHTYDWDAMPLRYKSSDSDYAKEQVAQLLYDLAVMCCMDFAPDGSGASSLSPIGLAEYFGYDKSMRYLDREFFSDAQWEKIIRDEIDAGRPVFHCGSSDRGGHAFVLDGYRGRYFSINYGWSGSSNNYYTMTPIEGHEKDLTEFYEYQDMVCNIKPDEGGEPFVNLVVSTSFRPFSWDFETDTVQMAGIWLWDYGSTGQGEVPVAYCLFDKAGRFKARLSEPAMMGGEEWLVPYSEFAIPRDISDGDRLMLARPDDKDGWTPLPQYRGSYWEFDRSRKIPEMVSAGYRNDSKQYFYLKVYKDFFWELSYDDTGEVILNSGTGSWESLLIPSVKLVDTETGLCEVQFRLSGGRYRLRFRNFDEELSFTFEL